MGSSDKNSEYRNIILISAGWHMCDDTDVFMYGIGNMA